MDAVMQPMGGELADHDKPMFRPGEHFLRFLIVRLLGRGGNSEVYEVLDRGKRCAIKVLRRRFMRVLRQNRRAEREGRLLVRIQHPNVVDVQEVGIAESPGRHEGIFFIRMELLEGLELREAMYRIGPMSIGLAGSWIRQAAHGAHQCHAVGIVHRDIKPENIFLKLKPPRTVKLLDLGIAIAYDKRFATIETEEIKHSPVGTALYMAPEMATGEGTASPATDVYALGMTLREMLVGEHFLFPEGSSYDYWAIVRRQVHGGFPPLTEEKDGIPFYLSDVIARALSKDPRQRQPNGLAFANEVDAACRRYAAEHPDEDANPGEPTMDWLLEPGEVPSFGTGPASARVSAPGARPPTENERRSGRISAVRPSAARVTQRFPAQHFAIRERAPEIASVPANVVLNPDCEGLRSTDPLPAPHEPRRYDTISLEPEQRDPTCVVALAPYRRARAVPSAAATAPPAPLPQRRGAIPRRMDTRLLAIPLAASVVLMSVVVTRNSRPVAPERLTNAGVSSDAGVPVPMDSAPPRDATLGITLVVPAASTAPSADAGRVQPDAGAKPVQKPAPSRQPSTWRSQHPHVVDIF